MSVKNMGKPSVGPEFLSTQTISYWRKNHIRRTSLGKTEFA
jgi:hypothetical protein